MFEVQIVGRGVVGEATGEVLRRLGNEVWYHDVDDGKSDTGGGPMPADMHFVCTPEDAVESAVNSLVEEVGTESPVVVRSTVPVGTIDGLAERYPDATILHFPEFLRQATSTMDEWTPNLLVAGVPKGCLGEERYTEAVECLSNVYNPLVAPPLLYRTPAVNSELLKLALNAFLSTTISFWNEVHSIASNVGANSHAVALMARQDPRVPEYGTLHGEPFGGRCLPKDLDQLVTVAEDADVKPELLRTVKNVNNRTKLS